MKTMAVKIFILLSAFTVFSCSTSFDNSNDPLGDSYINRSGFNISSLNIIITEGKSNTVNISLASIPYSDVEINFVEGMPSGIQVVPESIVFTRENYSEPRTVEIFCEDNMLVAGAASRELAPEVISEDLYYGIMAFPVIDIIVNDDDILPVIVQKVPYPKQTGVDLRQQILVTFSKEMERSSIENPENFSVRDSRGSQVEGIIKYYKKSRMAVFQMKKLMDYNTEYTVTLRAGIRDSAGNPCAEETVFSFRSREISRQPVAETDEEIEGTPMAIDLAGNYACVVTNYDEWDPGNEVLLNKGRLYVFDVSDIEQPVLRGSIQLSYAAEDVKISGNHAYVAVSDKCLDVVNISNPASPWVRSRLNIIDGTEQGTSDSEDRTKRISITGSYACLASTLSGLYIVDISDPANPGMVKNVNDGNCNSVTIAGSFAYLGNGNNFDIYDITDTWNPDKTGSVTIPGASRLYDIEISGNHAFINTYNQGMWIVDVSDCENPSIVSSIESYNSRGLKVSGDYACLTGTKGAGIINIADLEKPWYAGFYNVKSSEDLFISGTTAYLLTHSDPYRVAIVDIDITKSTYDPVPVTSYTAFDSAQSIALSGEYACVCNSSNTVEVINIADPDSIHLSGSYPTAYPPNDVAIAGEYACVATGSMTKPEGVLIKKGRLEIIDIASPNLPVSAGFYEMTDMAKRVIVLGNYAYVLFGPLSYMGADDGARNGLHIFDISDPEHPVLKSTYETGSHDHADDIAISGKHAYIAGMIKGKITILDISDPVNPVYKGVKNDVNGAFKISIAGNYACVTSYGKTFYILDISNPLDPVLKGSCGTPGSIKNIAVAGTYAYLSSEDALQVVDFSNPEAPSQVLNSDLCPTSYGISVSGNYAYLSAGPSGLEIIHLGKYCEGAPHYE